MQKVVHVLTVNEWQRDSLVVCICDDIKSSLYNFLLHAFLLCGKTQLLNEL